MTPSHRHQAQANSLSYMQVCRTKCAPNFLSTDHLVLPDTQREASERPAVSSPAMRAHCACARTLLGHSLAGNNMAATAPVCFISHVPYLILARRNSCSPLCLRLPGRFSSLSPGPGMSATLEFVTTQQVFSHMDLVKNLVRPARHPCKLLGTAPTAFVNKSLRFGQIHFRLLDSFPQETKRGNARWRREDHRLSLLLHCTRFGWKASSSPDSQPAQYAELG